MERRLPTTLRWRSPLPAADRLCDRLGVPVDVPVVHCDDFNDAIDGEPEFFRRAVLASRRPVNMYGNIALPVSSLTWV